jgi:acetoin utilization protein AcuB
MRHPIAVSDAMSKPPRCIGSDQGVAKALERMRALEIRHLPVLEGGALVGVLSERDGALALAAAPESAETMLVEEAMSAIPYCVPPEAPLREVAGHMAARKLGCAVVMNDGHIVGLMTTTDALRVLSELLATGG